MKKLKVLFLCTGNSCRSQMAEAFTKKLKSDVIDAYSAGIEVQGLNPSAVKVMKEVGIDISSNRSKTIEEFKNIEFNYVITLCGHAKETCPHFSGKCTILHFGFNDPPKMAEKFNDKNKKIECYRKVRDEIKHLIEKLDKILV